MSRTGASAAADGHLPATLDWQTASIVRRNDRALIVLELPTSTSSVATIPMTGSTLRRQAAEWGFVPLTGSGRVPTNPTDWEVWHTSAGLVVRLRERGRALLACIPAANIVKRADLKLGETTDLLIAVVESPIVV